MLCLIPAAESEVGPAAGKTRKFSAHFADNRPGLVGKGWSETGRGGRKKDQRRNEECPRRDRQLATGNWQPIFRYHRKTTEG